MKFLINVMLTIFLVKTICCHDANRHYNREVRSPSSKLSGLHNLANDFDNLRLAEHYFPDTEFYLGASDHDILEPFSKDVKNTFRSITANKPKGHVGSKNIAGSKPMLLMTTKNPNTNKPEKHNVEPPVVVSNISEKERHNTLENNDENLPNNYKEEITNSSSISVNETFQEEDNSTLIKHQGITSDTTENKEYDCHESLILTLEPCGSEEFELTNIDICTKADEQNCSHELVIDLHEPYESDFESNENDEISGSDLNIPKEINSKGEKQNRSYELETASHEFNESGIRIN